MFVPPTRKAIVLTNVNAGGLPVLPARDPHITKVVHHQNFQSGGYVVGHSVATHRPGVACSLHDHRGADELFQVLSGRGVIAVGDRKHRVRAGDSVYVPAGTMHQVIAAPTADESFSLLCVLIMAPGHEADKQPWLPTTA